MDMDVFFLGPFANPCTTLFIGMLGAKKNAAGWQEYLFGAHGLKPSSLVQDQVCKVARTLLPHPIPTPTPVGR